MPDSNKRSWRTRWLMLRAQLSLPAMLSQMDEKRVVGLAAAVAGSAAIIIISLVAWVSGLPLLFPSLAPSAFILFTRPFSEAAKPRSVMLGHTMGIASGYAAWVAVSWLSGQRMTLAEPGLAVCLSATAGFAMTSLLMIRFACPHAPACATALIVATGGVVAWPHLLVMVATVALLAGQSIVIHRLLGVHVPLWQTDTYHEAATQSQIDTPGPTAPNDHQSAA